MLSGALACSLVMTSITLMTAVVAQETTEDTGSDNTELKRVEYDGSLESQEALERETGGFRKRNRKIVCSCKGGSKNYLF